jgi:rhodanese-like protein
MLKRWLFRVLLLTALTALGAGAAWANGDDAPRIGKDDAKAMLGKAGTTIIDVRTLSDWKESTLKIKGAVREDPTAVESWASHYPKDRTLILYCA